MPNESIELVDSVYIVSGEFSNSFVTPLVLGCSSCCFCDMFLVFLFTRCNSSLRKNPCSGYLSCDSIRSQSIRFRLWFSALAPLLSVSFLYVVFWRVVFFFMHRLTFCTLLGYSTLSICLIGFVSLLKFWLNSLNLLYPSNVNCYFLVGLSSVKLFLIDCVRRW